MYTLAVWDIYGTFNAAAHRLLLSSRFSRVFIFIRLRLSFAFCPSGETTHTHTHTLGHTEHTYLDVWCVLFHFHQYLFSLLKFWKHFLCLYTISSIKYMHKNSLFVFGKLFISVCAQGAFNALESVKGRRNHLEIVHSMKSFCISRVMWNEIPWNFTLSRPHLFRKIRSLLRSILY